MHPSSMDNMRKARQKIETKLGNRLSILDVGGRDIKEGQDRSYRSIFNDVCQQYYIADIKEGPNVTHVMPGPYTLPFEDNSIDLIVCGQVLEHVKNPFRSVAEMKRVLKPGRFMILIAPSMGKAHDALDCWRFMPDAFKAIAEEVELKVIGDWVDNWNPKDRSGRWADHTFIGQK